MLKIQLHFIKPKRKCVTVIPFLTQTYHNSRTKIYLQINNNLACFLHLILVLCLFIQAVIIIEKPIIKDFMALFFMKNPEKLIPHSSRNRIVASFKNFYFEERF